VPDAAARLRNATSTASSKLRITICPIRKITSIAISTRSDVSHARYRDGQGRAPSRGSAGLRRRSQ
jgi:hypothetical protein